MNDKQASSREYHALCQLAFENVENLLPSLKNVRYKNELLRSVVSMLYDEENRLDRILHPRKYWPGTDSHSLDVQEFLDMADWTAPDAFAATTMEIPQSAYSILDFLADQYPRPNQFTTTFHWLQAVEKIRKTRNNELKISREQPGSRPHNEADQIALQNADTFPR